MIKKYINQMVVLFFAWAVYAKCQHDVVLPFMAGLIVLATLLTRGKTCEKHYAWCDRLPLSALIILSLGIGMLWRTVMPIPEESLSPFPEFTAALQSASIFCAVWFWLKPFQKRNLYRLAFCAWLTVALSINVPFHLDTFLVFSAFCFVSISVVLLNTITRPPAKRYLLSYFRDYILFSTSLILCTTVLFFGISRSIVALDRAFLSMMSDYILPGHYTHFLRLDPKLSLISPGQSVFDRRPVMEISYPGAEGMYLRMQVFEDYDNGTWQEVPKKQRRAVKSDLSDQQPRGTLTMFTSFKDVVPFPAGLRAVQGRAKYETNDDQLLFTQDDQKTRMLDFTLTNVRIPAKISEQDRKRYTLLPSRIADRLKTLSNAITGEAAQPQEIAARLTEYFRANFQYSLDVPYSADDQGLITMLEEKRPAYCTYFASAMALLLRAQGIPARVVAGFLTTEKVKGPQNTFLTRVRDAHAWTEYLDHVIDPVTQEDVWVWIPVDATPAGIAGASVGKTEWINLDQVLENLWISSLRWNARFENMDKNQLKVGMILMMLLFMAWINRQKWLELLLRWFKRGNNKTAVQYETSRDLIQIYQLYQHLLKRKLNETMGQSDTDQEVLKRIKRDGRLERSVYLQLEHFIALYQSARFGQDINLKGSLRKQIKSLESLMRKSFKEHALPL